jgi:hypothetical protein
VDTDAAAFAEFYSSASDDCLRVVLATVRDRQTAESDAALMAAVLRLPLRQRQVIACRLFLDLDTAQTAQTIGIAPAP